MNLEKLKYPVGKINFDPNTAPVMKTTWIESIKSLPQKLEAVLENVEKEDLNLIYRPEGWTIAQVIHHLADSHMIAYSRTKMALAQGHPNVPGYDESIWANYEEAKDVDIKPSLEIIKGLHKRWAQTWESCSAADFENKYHHLGYKKDFDLMHVLNIYAWHSNHHLAHIHQALRHRGDFS